MARFACRFSTQLADNGGKRQARSLPSRSGAGDSRRLCDGCGVAPIPCTKREMPSAGMLFSFSGGATPSSDRAFCALRKKSGPQSPRSRRGACSPAASGRLLAFGEIPGKSPHPNRVALIFIQAAEGRLRRIRQKGDRSRIFPCSEQDRRA